jgi:hypothetical protein
MSEIFFEEGNLANRSGLFYTYLSEDTKRHLKNAIKRVILLVGQMLGSL